MKLKELLEILRNNLAKNMIFTFLFPNVNPRESFCSKYFLDTNGLLRYFKVSKIMDDNSEVTSGPQIMTSSLLKSTKIQL